MNRHHRQRTVIVHIGLVVILIVTHFVNAIAIEVGIVIITAKVIDIEIGIVIVSAIASAIPILIRIIHAAYLRLSSPLP